MSTPKFDLTKLDLYEIIGVPEDATEKQIVKAYRKKALKHHPDKNPDNPQAADLFHQLSKALEVLTDGAAKAAYDKILKAKKAAQIRHKQFDSKRKKFKDDLDERERQARTQKETAEDSARNLQTEIERLRKEGSRLLEREQEILKEELARKSNLLAGVDDRSSSDEEEKQVSAKLKIKWKLNKKDNSLESYTQDELTCIFSKYGEVLNILVSVKKSGTAIVELASPFAADLAVRNETGKPDNPFTLTWLQGNPSQNGRHDSQTQNTRVDPGDLKQGINTTSDQPASVVEPVAGSRDFENLVLMKMRQAEERKRLIQQMKEEDGDT